MLQPTLWTVVACKSKVSKLEVDSVWIFSFLGSKEHILGLYVPVNYVLLVHVVHRKQKLLDYVRCPSFTESLDLDNVIVEFAARDQLSHNVEVCLVLEQLEDSDHVRVVCFLQDF